MGGYGSGYYRSDKKDTVNDYLQLDVNLLREGGKWIQSGVLTWRSAIRSSSLSFQVTDQDFIRLYWQNRNKQNQEQLILTTRIKQRVGFKYYFICPSCNRKVIKLYGVKFYCRACRNLTYESCQKNGMNKTLYGKLPFDQQEIKLHLKLMELEGKLETAKNSRIRRRIENAIDKIIYKLK